MPDISGVTADIIAYIGIDGEDKINTTLGNIKGKFGDLATSISSTSPIGIAIGAAAAVLGAAAGAAYSFDSNIQGLRGTLNADRGEIAKIGQDLLEISKVNPVTYTDLAEGIGAIHDQGVPASHYTALLSEAVTAASTGMGSLMDIIEGGIDSYERYRDYTSDLAKDQETLRGVYDKQFAIVGTGAINYKDLVDYTGKLLPIAGSLKLPMEQLYSAIATLNVNEANPAGLLMFLQSISKNREKWQKIGVEVFDPITGSIRGLDTIAREFNTLLIGKTAEEKTDLYNYLGLNRMTGPLFDTLLSNVGQLEGYLNTVATAQGQVRDRAKEATDNLGDQWQMIKNNLNAQMIELGKTTLPPVVDLLKAINTEIAAWNSKPEVTGAGPLTTTYTPGIPEWVKQYAADNAATNIKESSKALAGENGKGGLAASIAAVGNAAGDKRDGASEKVNALNIKMKEWRNMSADEQALAGIEQVTKDLANNVQLAALHIGTINTEIKPVGNDWRDYTENYKTLSGLIGTVDTGLVGGMRGLKNVSVLAKQPMIDVGDAVGGAGDKVKGASDNSFDLAEAFGAIAKATGNEELSKGLNLIGGLASSFAQGGVVGGAFAIFSTLVGSLVSLGSDKQVALTVDQVIDSLGALGDRVKEIQDFKFDENALFSDELKYVQDQITALISKGSTLTVLEKQRLNELLASIEPLKKLSDSLDLMGTYNTSVGKTLELARSYASTFGSSAMAQSNDMMIRASLNLINYIKTLEAGTPAYNQSLYDLAKLQAELGNTGEGLSLFLGDAAQKQVQSYIDLINTFGDSAYDAATGIRSFSVELDSMLKQLTGQYTQFEKDTKSVSETIIQLLHFKIDLDTTYLDEKIALSIKSLNAYLATLNPDSDAWKDAKKLIDELTQKFNDLGGAVEDIPNVNIGTTGVTPAYASGGFVPNTGIAMLHGNEFVLNREATSALGAGALQQFNATLNPSVLVGDSVANKSQQQTVINIVAGNTTPETWFKVSDQYIQPRINTRTRKYEVKANPYAN